MTTDEEEEKSSRSRPDRLKTLTMSDSSLRNEIDELNQRHSIIKQKWIDKQRNLQEILSSVVVLCQNKEENISSKFVSNEKTSTKVEKPIEEVPNESTLKIERNSFKRRFPSWMGLPTRRGTLIPRERPSRHLLHLLSTLSTNELEREQLNIEMDQLLNRQTAMEKLLARRFFNNDTIQEYCQYTTRDECPYANPHLSRRRSRSSSTSSDESSTRKKRKKDENQSSETKRSSTSFHRKTSRSSNNCGKVHFRRLIKQHTDISLGDCSFLNTCFHMDTCKYIHYQIDKTDFVTSSSTTTKPNRTLPIVERISPGSIPAQWVQCDLRQFDMSVLGKFSVIMADPPWDIHMELPYGTMADEEMRQLSIPSLQDDGYIFLWVTGRAMELGRECLRIWGYQRCDEIIWVKTNQLQRIIRTGRTGHWLNHGKEHCLVGVKGSPKGDHRGLDCDVIVAEVRATSRKPDEIYGIIERLSPRTRKVELFGRPHNVQPNWITLGNQLDGVRLVEPDVVRRFRQRYPDGYQMTSANQQQQQPNETKSSMSNLPTSSK